MQCDRCQTSLTAEDGREFRGQTLCEDCYMDAFSPARSCDPWAVLHAKGFQEEGRRLSTVQEQILAMLTQKGHASPAELIGRLGIGQGDLEREIAALRHMEKVRGAMVDGKKVFRLW